MQSLGFGFVEVGSVSNLPSPGNPKPRLFRLTKDKALINRLGLNNEGPEAMLRRLRVRRSTFPVGINIAKTNRADILGRQAIRDYCSLL